LIIEKHRELSRATEPVTVRVVASRRQWTEFFGLARSIQGFDPNWIEPLRLERRHQWAPSHPFFEHATAQPFVAYQSGRPVGCISAQLDPRHPPEQGHRVGYFGQLEGIDSAAVFQALLEAAGRWLSERGCRLMRGPFDLNINQSCGLLVDGFDSPPMVMMGHAPKWYARRLEQQGLYTAVNLLAYRVSIDFQAPPAMVRVLSSLGTRLRFRTLDFRNYREELRVLRTLFNDAWSSNWGFVPLSEAEFDRMGRDLRQLVRPQQTCVAELDGSPAGFMILLPNLNEMIVDLRGSLLPLGWARLLWRLARRRFTTARVPLMGVAKAYQQGLASAAIGFGMIDRLRQAGRSDGVTEVEMSWILESNQAMRALIESLGSRISKRYRIYERVIER